MDHEEKQRVKQQRIREQAERDAASEILHRLAKEDLLYQHHGNVCAREEAYERLASYYRKTATMREVAAELSRAREKFPRPQNSAHEGFAVLKEEVDELWDEVKANHPERRARMREEAIQVAAMAIRFAEECT